MRDDSTPSFQEPADIYAALIKPGDAVETPDGEPWVVVEAGAQLELSSASRDSTGQICADHIEPTRTSVPAALVTKVADARQVRR